MASGTSQADLLLELEAYRYASSFPDFPANFVPPALSDPNYVPPFRGMPVIVLVSVTIAISILVVVVRLLARTTVDKHAIGLDDCFIVAGLVCYLVTLIFQTNNAAGFHNGSICRATCTIQDWRNWVPCL
jgi:hypothetical protein